MEQPIYLELNLKTKMQELVRGMAAVALHELTPPEVPEVQEANITYIEGSHE